MAITYHKAYKVPLWIVVSSDCSEEVKGWAADWCSDTGALRQDWPAATYVDTLYSFRSRGYQAAIPVGKSFILETGLLLRSADAHVKKTISELSKLGGSVSVPPHQLDRNVHSEADLATIFNDLLSLEDPIALSQIFQVGERCFNETTFGKQYRAFYSVGDAPKGLLVRLADRIVTIGDISQSDISFGEMDTQESVYETLNNFFIKD